MKAQAESRQTLVLGVYAREFPGGLLKLDPAFAYREHVIGQKMKQALKNMVNTEGIASSCVQ